MAAANFQTSGTPTVTGLSSLAFTVTLTGAASTTGTINFSSTYAQHVSHGWACQGNDMTTAGVTIRETSTTVSGSTSSATFAITGSPGAADVLQFMCAGY